jgi:hypothetical protein
MVSREQTILNWALEYAIRWSDSRGCTTEAGFHKAANRGAEAYQINLTDYDRNKWVDMIRMFSDLRHVQAD